MNELNAEQRAAVESDAKKRLVIAGPGSGKTRTLVAAIARECREHSPIGVVAITFTVAAAGELERRLAEEAPGLGIDFCGTLHAFCLKLLREHGMVSMNYGFARVDLNIPAQLGVVDDEQKEALALGIARDMGVKMTGPNLIAALGQPTPKPGAVLGKEQLVAKEYRSRLKAGGLLDFDMVLEEGRRTAMEMARRGEWPYRALFVDELQDSSDADWACYDAFACERQFMVGDGDQQIMSFRQPGGVGSRQFTERARAAQAQNRAFDPPGASKRPINEPGAGKQPLNAPLDPAWQLFTLQSNHRCARAVCAAADRLVERNAARVPKRNAPVRQYEGSVLAIDYETPAHEMNGITDRIVGYTATRSATGGLPPHDYEHQDIAVLCRTNVQVRAFADFLKSRGVPVAEESRPQDPPDWRRTKLLLSVLANPWADLAVRNLHAIDCGEEVANWTARNAQAAMHSLNEHFQFKFGHGDGSVSALDADLLKHGVGPESRERVHDACRALSARGDWTLAELALYCGSGERRREEKGEGVTVCTVHGFKGREASVVFVPGCEEGLFPGKKESEGDALEESRRLCFVAMTRAKDALVLSWCRTRPQSRGPNVPPGPPEPRERSRFVSEAGLA